MPQTLYRFGFDPNQSPASKTNTPKPTSTAVQIAILWISWCDLIYTTCDSNNLRAIVYEGTGLNAAQKEQFTSPVSLLHKFSQDQACHLSFFGNAMNEGVRGFILGHVVCIFGTPAEEVSLGSRYSNMSTHCVPKPFDLPLAEVRMCSNDSLMLVSSNDGQLLATSSGPFEPRRRTPDVRSANVGIVAGIQELKGYCNNTVHPACLSSFAPKQLVVNAITATALDKYGQVHTRTADPRYPACLGRPYTGTSTFEPVSYLSETRITKIASGGYMTAAVSEDGELFLWGQSNPGTESELGVLHRLDYQSDPALRAETAIWSDAMQDEYVKVVNIYIDGKAALAYDVAIGCGHILVAARVEGGQHVMFAAGRGSEGQFGLGRNVTFLDEFEEVVELRGKPIVQIEAAGWSSSVVTVTQ